MYRRPGEPMLVLPAPDEEAYAAYVESMRTVGVHRSLTTEYHMQRCTNAGRAVKIMFKRFDTNTARLRHLMRLNMLVDTDETPESVLEGEDSLHTGDGGRLSTRGGVIITHTVVRRFLLDKENRRRRRRRRAGGQGPPG
jgi:hypothetical protein